MTHLLFAVGILWDIEPKLFSQKIIIAVPSGVLLCGIFLSILVAYKAYGCKPLTAHTTSDLEMRERI